MITSRLCSITTIELPVSANLCKTSISLSTSAMCKPVVGSSKIYNVFPVGLLLNSVANLILCASPPDNWVDGWPSFIYESPTSISVSNFLFIVGIFSKNSNASSTFISNTSEIVLSLYLTWRVSLLYLSPLHTSQGTYTSGRKCISILIIPSPLQASHLPPFTLKLNLPFLYPLAFASLVIANKSLIWSNIPVYVAGFDLGVLPIGLWSILIILSIFSIPFISLCLPGFILDLFTLLATLLYKISFISVLFPEPETPVIHTNFPKGIFTFKFLRLFSLAFTISINSPFPSLIVSGTSIVFFPLRYIPVIEFGFRIISSNVPWATISPPCTPAPGPISTI